MTARPSLFAMATCSWLCASWALFAVPLVASRGAAGLMDALTGALWAPVIALFVVAYWAMGGETADASFPSALTGFLVGAAVGASIPWVVSRLGCLPWNR